MNNNINNPNKLTISEETRQKTNYTPSKDKKEFVGFVYIRSIIINGVKYIYIGESTDMLTRNYHWRCLKVVYGGKDLEIARKNNDPSLWLFDVLERVDASNADELEEKLKQKEAEYIIKYESYKEDKGFNSTRGLAKYLKPANNPVAVC
jgi:hypothetical protein